MALGSLLHHWKLENGPLADAATTPAAVGGATLTAASSSGDIAKADPSSDLPGLGAGLTFASANTQYLRYAASPPADAVPAAGKTYVVDYEPVSLGSTADILALSDGGGGSDRIVIRQVVTTGLLQVVTFASSTNYGRQSTSQVFTAGQACQIAVVVPDPIGTVVVYADGQAVAVEAPSANAFPDDGLTIGARFQTSVSNPANGTVRDARIYDGAGTAADMAGVYADARAAGVLLGRPATTYPLTYPLTYGV